MLHPLLPSAAQSDPGTNLDRIPLKRPRFTMSEIILLNELVNRSPEAVGVSRLRRVLQSYSARSYGVTLVAVSQHIATIRAKLGEVSRRPTMIVTTYLEFPNGDRELGYLYREPS